MSKDRFKNIRSQLELLKQLSTCKDKYRNAIIKTGDKELVGALCECVYNVLLGNIKIEDDMKKNLHKYRLSLRKLVQKSALNQKKKILIQKGGFLKFLLPVIVSSLISLINKK